jgi:hypothetical protein
MSKPKVKCPDVGAVIIEITTVRFEKHEVRGIKNFWSVDCQVLFLQSV